MINQDPLKALQATHLATSKNEEILAGAVKLYGAVADTETAAYHAMAHVALDAMLDAARARHRHLEEMLLRGKEDEE